MKLLNLIGMAVLLAGPGAVLAQNPLAPGVSRPALDNPSANLGYGLTPPPPSAAPAAPKTDIANVAEKHERRVKMIWIASIAAMLAGTTADAASSWHKREANSILASSDGTLGGKGVSIKAGIAAGVLVPQIIFRNHRDWRAAFAIGNFAEAGVFTGATIHNLNVK